MPDASNFNDGVDEMQWMPETSTPLLPKLPFGMPDTLNSNDGVDEMQWTPETSTPSLPKSSSGMPDASNFNDGVDEMQWMPETSTPRIRISKKNAGGSGFRLAGFSLARFGAALLALPAHLPGAQLSRAPKCQSPIS